LTSFREIVDAGRFRRRFARIPGCRGVALWWLGRNFPIVVAEYHHLRAFLLLERLFPRRRRYLVLLQFIHVSEEDWGTVETRGWPQHRLRTVFEKHVIRPAISRTLLRAQVLSREEQRRQTRYFNLPPGTMRFIPWSLATPLRHEPPEPNVERRGVFASGRAACDWPTVFAVAQDEEWPLTVVCGEDDLDNVLRLNASGRATVSSEIRMAAHDSLMRNAAVYLLALKEARVSSGHLRLATAIQCRTPVVVSNVRGLADYVRPNVNALTFDPGDIVDARSKIRRLLEDPALGSRLADTAAELAKEWTPDDYLSALRELINEACAVALDGSS
jgi:hypothetical protein